MMAENRLNRELETREKTTRKKSWNRPEVLPSPTPEEGYAFRWIRVAMQGTVDATNVSSKLREGWEAVRSEEYPDYEAPTIEDGKFAGVIGNGGLMLCRIPIETANERNEYYGTRTREAMTAVDQDLMKEQNPLMPIHQSRQSRVTFGRGKPPSD